MLWTLHLKSSCTDLNTLKHFIHNSVIIITLFFSHSRVRYLDMAELSMFWLPKALPQQPCVTNSSFLFLQCDLSLFHLLKTLAPLLYVIWFPSINCTAFIVTFKQPVFAYDNAHKNSLLEIYFMYLDSKESYSILKASCIIAVLFSTKCHLLHKFIFFCLNNMFFINHELKFKYQPGCLKV
jgi:hypothetical protein